MINYSFKILISIIALSLLFSNNASSELYKWTDKNGVINYTETKPNNENSESLVLPSNKINTIKTPKISDKEINKIFGKDSYSQRIKNKQIKKEKEESVLACLEMKEVIRSMELEIPVYMDKYKIYHVEGSEHYLKYKGKRSVVTDSKRPKVIKKLEDKFSSDCEKYEIEIEKAEKQKDSENHMKMCNHLRKKLKYMKNPDSHTINSKINRFETYVERECSKR